MMPSRMLILRYAMVIRNGSVGVSADTQGIDSQSNNPEIGAQPSVVIAMTTGSRFSGRPEVMDPSLPTPKALIARARTMVGTLMINLVVIEGPCHSSALEHRGRSIAACARVWKWHQAEHLAAQQLRPVSWGTTDAPNASIPCPHMTHKRHRSRLQVSLLCRM